MTRDLIDELLGEFKVLNSENVTARILYSLISGECVDSTNKCDHSDLRIQDDLDIDENVENQDNDIWDLEFETFEDPLYGESEAILTKCLQEEWIDTNMERKDDNDDINNIDDNEITMTKDDVVSYFVDSVSKQATIDWNIVWQCFDNPKMNRFDTKSLVSLTKISRQLSVMPFITRVLTSSQWKNQISLFNIIKYSLPCVSIHCCDPSRVVCFLKCFSCFFVCC